MLTASYLQNSPGQGETYEADQSPPAGAPLITLPRLKPKAVMALRQFEPLGAAAVGLCHAT